MIPIAEAGTFDYEDMDMGRPIDDSTGIEDFNPDYYSYQGISDMGLVFSDTIQFGGRSGEGDWFTPDSPARKMFDLIPEPIRNATGSIVSFVQGKIIVAVALAVAGFILFHVIRKRR